MVNADHSEGKVLPHSYRVSIDHFTNNRGDLLDGRSLSFETTNHDDIFAIVERIKEINILPDREAAEFAIGLKLFSEVLMRHRGEQPFAELWPHFGNFIKQLKGWG